MALRNARQRLAGLNGVIAKDVVPLYGDFDYDIAFPTVELLHRIKEHVKVELVPGQSTNDGFAVNGFD